MTALDRTVIAIIAALSDGPADFDTLTGRLEGFTPERAQKGLEEAMGRGHVVAVAGEYQLALRARKDRTADNDTSRRRRAGATREPWPGVARGTKSDTGKEGQES